MRATHDRPRRRGPGRAGTAVLLCASLLTACAGQNAAGPPATPWFGGYDNVLVTEDGAGTATGTVLLSFVVADTEDACTPSWGGSYDLDAASTAPGLESRIETLRQTGGEVAVSFGGAALEELATVCEDPGLLRDAYATVIDRYGLDTVDFDVEADDLGSTGAGVRRSQAVAQLQEQHPADDPLEVWVTLPVGVEGMGQDTREVVAQMLAAEVELAGVNLMTMNYGQGAAAGQDLVGSSTAAARAAQAQVKDLYAQAGQTLSEEQAWARIGLTPMIGQNDVEDEVLDLAAARQLNRCAREQGVGRISFWSLDRDRSCGEGTTAGRASDDCSGIDQEPGDFARVLGEGLDP